MISKAKAIKGSAASIDYIMKEEKNCFELCRNDVIGENGNEILAEFREVQSINDNCKNNTFSIVLSPNNDQVHNAQELRKFTEKHLENLGLKNNQYIAYVHQNTKATHVHIIANRINYKGKALDDSYIGFKAQNSAESIAKENGLTTAKEIRQEKAIERQLNKEINKEIKADIYKAHNISVKQSKTFPEYIQNMHNKGYKIEPVINKGNNLQGFKIHDKMSGLTFKASEINKNCGIKTMLEKGVSFKGMTLQNLGKEVTKNITDKATLITPINLTPPLLKIASLSIKLFKSAQKGFEIGM